MDNELILNAGLGRRLPFAFLFDDVCLVQFSKLISAGNTSKEQYGCIVFSSSNARYWL